MKTKKANKSSGLDVQKMVLLALLIAILFLMAVTPLGYLKTAGLEITFNTIPVAIGAVLLGPVGGAILGGIFGLTSFCQCLGIFGFSTFGATLLGINPVFTFITCFVPRILCGLLAGVAYRACDKFTKTKFSAPTVACLACPLLNTVFFMTAIMTFFGSSSYIGGMMGDMNPFLFVLAFVGFQGAVELVVCFIVATAIVDVLLVLQKKLGKNKSRKTQEV